MSEVLVDKRWMFRIGGYAAVAGAVVGLVGNLIHPETSGPGDPEATARVVADSQIWVPLHFALAVAFILMLLGLVAIHDSITGGLAGALARLGLASPPSTWPTRGRPLRQTLGPARSHRSGPTIPSTSRCSVR